MMEQGIPPWMQYNRYLEAAQRGQFPLRACEECKRKKTKCDMRRPICSLCMRIGADCVYPTRRKRNRRPEHMSSKKVHTSIETNTTGITQSTESNRHINSLPPQTTRSPAFDTQSTYDNGTTNFSGCQGTNQVQFPGATEYALSYPYLSMSFPALHQDQNGLDNMSTDLLSLEGPSPNFVLELDEHNIGAVIVGDEITHSDDNDTFIISASTNTNQCESSSLKSFSDPTLYMGDPSPKDEEVLLSIDVPPCVGDHLVEVFFEKVQCSLPLLHRPTFCATIIGSKLSSENRYKQLNFETALLLNGMFALSARFSDSSDIWAGDPKDRGEIFAKKAKALCNRYLGADCDREPTLRALQGRILLTYYQLTYEPCFQAWLGTGECCRMAYSLYLHQIDRDTAIPAEKSGDPVQNWVDQEELRRAWWAIFQLDGFASVIAFRPFNIDHQNMDVFLPVSDDAWFSGRPTASAKLSSKGPSSTWRCLEGCENQDPYAWYLICTYLVRAAFKEFEKKERLTEDLEILQSALQCFALNLPDQFRLSAANMRFNENNFAEKNWVICTTILLQTAQILVVLTLKLENLSTQQPELTSDPSSPRACQSYTEFVAECGQYINDRLRAVRLWSADYMQLASPLVACALIGPAAVHAAKRPHHGGSKDEMLSSLAACLLDLSLHRFGKFWRLGEFLEEFLKSVLWPSSTPPISPGKPKLTWVQGLMSSVLARG